MNLRTWFKGLGVFVLSSFITAVATMTLDPAGFNFSKAGLAKVGTAALVIGVKAVLLYLKQSPLPDEEAKIAGWTKISGVLALCLILPASLLMTGCVSSWDRSTYASLAASKALIDCAVAGYNHFDADIRHACAANPDDTAFDPRTFYLPQTRDAQQAVERARQAGKTGGGDRVSGAASYIVERRAWMDGEEPGGRSAHSAGCARSLGRHCPIAAILRIRTLNASAAADDAVSQFLRTEASRKALRIVAYSQWLTAQY